MMFLIAIVLSPILLVNCISPAFDDSLLFRVRYEPEAVLAKENFFSAGLVSVRSSKQEEYKCHLPTLTPERSVDEERADYSGASPYELIKQLHVSKTPCTYRIETYWAYELCHGKYIQQYHEEKDQLKRVRRQEYYLGTYVESYATEMESAFDVSRPPTRVVSGQTLPYVPVVYIQGTVCDLTGKARVTTLLYVCEDSGRGQMDGIVETSSCVYEVIVPVRALCQHPSFRPRRATTYDIICSSAIEATAREPQESVRWRTEQQAEFKEQYMPWTQTAARVPSSDVLRADVSTVVGKPVTRLPDKATEAPPAADKTLIDSFLSGETCLHGGNGWWRHEYCHLKRIIQFHETKDARDEILLGSWDEERQRAYIKEFPHKAPIRDKGVVFQATHLYGGGSACEATGKPRQVEVRVRCIAQASGSSPNAVTLSLSEPSTCEYVLRVEGHMFCDVLQTVDKDGVLPV